MKFPIDFALGAIAGMLTMSIAGFMDQRHRHRQYEKELRDWQKGRFVLIREKPLPAECFVFGPLDGSWASHPIDGACLHAWALKHQRRGETVRVAIDREYRKAMKAARP